MKTNGRYSTPETRAAAVAMYAAGIPAGEVAERIGTSATSVVAWVRKAGGEVRRPGGREKTEDDALGYDGGWVRDGLTWRPSKPNRRPSVLSVGMGETWENSGRTENGPGPAASTAGLIRGLTDADRSAS